MASSLGPLRQAPAGSELAAALIACRQAFIAIGVFSGVSNLLMLSGALFMLEVYDRVLPSRSVPTLIALVILVTGLYAAQGVIETIRSRILVRVGNSLDEAMGMRVYDAVVRLPLKSGSRAEGAQPIRDLDTVRGFLSGAGPVALFDLPWMPVYLIVCFVFHPYIGLTALDRRDHSGHAHGAHRIEDAAADPHRHPIRGGAQRADGGEPAQRRSDHGHGHGRAHRAPLGRPQSQIRGVEPGAPATSPAVSARCRRCCACCCSPPSSRSAPGW